jgi:hypothetical protein
MANAQPSHTQQALYRYVMQKAPICREATLTPFHFQGTFSDHHLVATTRLEGQQNAHLTLFLPELSNTVFMAVTDTYPESFTELVASFGAESESNDALTLGYAERLDTPVLSQFGWDAILLTSPKQILKDFPSQTLVNGEEYDFVLLTLITNDEYTYWRKNGYRELMERLGANKRDFFRFHQKTVGNARVAMPAREASAATSAPRPQADQQQRTAHQPNTRSRQGAHSNTPSQYRTNGTGVTNHARAAASPQPRGGQRRSLPLQYTNQCTGPGQAYTGQPRPEQFRAAHQPTQPVAQQVTQQVAQQPSRQPSQQQRPRFGNAYSRAENSTNAVQQPAPVHHTMGAQQQVTGPAEQTGFHRTPYADHPAPRHNARQNNTPQHSVPQQPYGLSPAHQHAPRPRPITSAASHYQANGLTHHWADNSAGVPGTPAARQPARTEGYHPDPLRINMGVEVSEAFRTGNTDLLKVGQHQQRRELHDRRNKQRRDRSPTRPATQSRTPSAQSSVPKQVQSEKHGSKTQTSAPDFRNFRGLAIESITDADYRIATNKSADLMTRTPAPSKPAPTKPSSDYQPNQKEKKQKYAAKQTERRRQQLNALDDAITDQWAQSIVAMDRGGQQRGARNRSTSTSDASLLELSQSNNGGQRGRWQVLSETALGTLMLVGGLFTTLFFVDTQVPTASVFPGVFAVAGIITLTSAFRDAMLLDRSRKPH